MIPDEYFTDEVPVSDGIYAMRNPDGGLSVMLGNWALDLRQRSPGARFCRLTPAAENAALRERMERLVAAGDAMAMDERTESDLVNAWADAKGIQP